MSSLYIFCFIIALIKLLLHLFLYLLPNRISNTRFSIFFPFLLGLWWMIQIFQKLLFLIYHILLLSTLLNDILFLMFFSAPLFLDFFIPNISSPSYLIFILLSLLSLSFNNANSLHEIQFLTCFLQIYSLGRVIHLTKT